MSVSATSCGLEDGDDAADDDRADDGEDGDRRVLAPDEGDRALEDRAGDVLHRRRPGVARQHVAGEVDGEQHGDDAGRQDDQLERTRIHQGRRVLHGLSSSSDAMARAGAPSRHGPGRSAGPPFGMRPMGGTFQAAASVTRRSLRGSNSRDGAGVCSIGRPRSYAAPAASDPVYCRTCESTTALGCLFEIVETLVLTLLIFLVIQNFVAQPYKVQQKSMERHAASQTSTCSSTS